MAILIRPDLSGEDVGPINRRTSGLGELQHHIGGYFEELPSQRIHPYLALGDEDGRSKGLVLNRVASLMLGYVVLGPVLIVRRTEME